MVMVIVKRDPYVVPIAASISGCVRCCIELGTLMVTVPSSMSMILLLHFPVEYNASFF